MMVHSLDVPVSSLMVIGLVVKSVSVAEATTIPSVKLYLILQDGTAS